MDRLWSESLYAGLFFSLSSSLRCSFWHQSNEKSVCPAWLKTKTNTWWDGKKQWERAGQNVFDQASILQVQIFMLRSEQGVFFADRTIFLFFSPAAGPPWLLCNAGLSVWMGKINKAWLRIFYIYTYIKKGKKKFLCILIAEQFAYLYGKWEGKKMKLSSEFPSPLPRQFSAQNPFI